MSKSIQTLALLASLALLSQAARAADDQPPRRRMAAAAMPARDGAPQRDQRPWAAAVERIERIQKAVMESATEDQKAKLKPLFDKALESAKAFQAAMEKNDAERREFSQKFMTEINEFRTQMEGLLTPEQKEKLKDAAGNMGPGMGGGGMGGPGGPVADRLQEAIAKLDLSPEQKEKVQKLQAETQEKMAKIRQDLQGDRENMMQAMREQMQETRARLQEILTPEQQEKLREIMSQGTGRPQRPQ